MLEARFRSRVSEAEMKQKVGKVLTLDDLNLVVKGPMRLIKPDGKPLCIYLPKAIPEDLAREVWPPLSAIRIPTRNRGKASGTERFNRGDAGRSQTLPVISSLLGSMDKMGPQTYCRLTAYTANEVGGWAAIQPLFQHVAALFAQHVPDRYQAQVKFARETQPEWVIKGTPFTTITVNNTYPTGVHTDKGDLDEGFSCLAVFRRGNYRGGLLCFPEYRVGVDMKDRDLLLMDAHEWHGNTAITCSACGARLLEPDHRCKQMDRWDDWPSPERVSVVHYYRTGMKDCDTLQAESRKAIAVAEQRMAARMEG